MLRSLSITFCYYYCKYFCTVSIISKYSYYNDRDLTKKYQKAFEEDYLKEHYSITKQNITIGDQFEKEYGSGDPEVYIKILVYYNFRLRDFCINLKSVTIENKKTGKKINFAEKLNEENAQGFYNLMKDVFLNIHSKFISDFWLPAGFK